MGLKLRKKKKFNNLVQQDVSDIMTAATTPTITDEDGKLISESDVIKPKQLDQITVSAKRGNYRNVGSSDEVNKRIGQYRRNRFSGPGMFDDNLKRRNYSTSDIYNTQLQNAIEEDARFPNHGDEIMRQSTYYPQLYKNANGELGIKHHWVQNGFEPSMEIVSPEFDALTLGMAANDLYKGVKLYNSLKKAPVSYTGVSKRNVPFFRQFKGNIFTTDDYRLARAYSGAKYGIRDPEEGQVFKIFDMQNGEGIVKIPEPLKAPNGENTLYDWNEIPYNINENGNVSKLGNPTVSSDSWGIWRTKGPVNNTTDDLITQAKAAGKRGVRIPRVTDGTYQIGETTAADGSTVTIFDSPPMTETIYDGNAPGLIRAPYGQPIWKTAYENASHTQRMGTSLTGPLINHAITNNQ